LFLKIKNKFNTNFYRHFAEFVWKSEKNTQFSLIQKVTMENKVSHSVSANSDSRVNADSEKADSVNMEQNTSQSSNELNELEMPWPAYSEVYRFVPKVSKDNNFAFACKLCVCVYRQKNYLLKQNFSIKFEKTCKSRIYLFIYTRIYLFFLNFYKIE